MEFSRSKANKLESYNKLSTLIRKMSLIMPLLFKNTKGPKNF